MKAEIEAILAGIPGVHVEPVGPLWSIVAGGLSGCRADGLGLARDLKAQYDYIKPRPIPEPEPVVVEEPVQVGHMDEPDDLEIPRFLAPPPEEQVPDELAALVEPGETLEQTRARLWALYRELQNKIMMALASREEIRLHERLHIHMGWLAAADERKF